jgi:HD superfamily phosphodiesterase
MAQAMRENGLIFDEQQLRATARPYFAAARAGDWEHALRVVRWVKELGSGRDDLYLLIAAAYLHDIGWSGVAPCGKLDLDELLALEPQANRNSTRLISEVLTSLHFTQQDIDTVNRLVAAADQHRSAADDEAIVVDADNLSKLCVEHLREKFKPESYAKALDLFENQLCARIQTAKGKELFPELLSTVKRELSPVQTKS